MKWLAGIPRTFHERNTKDVRPALGDSINLALSRPMTEVPHESPSNPATSQNTKLSTKPLLTPHRFSSGQPSSRPSDAPKIFQERYQDIPVDFFSAPNDQVEKGHPFLYVDR